MTLVPTCCSTAAGIDDPRSLCRRIDAGVGAFGGGPVGGSGFAFVVENLTCILPLADTDVRTRERRRIVAAAAAAAARLGQGKGRSNADV